MATKMNQQILEYLQSGEEQTIGLGVELVCKLKRGRLQYLQYTSDNMVNRDDRAMNILWDRLEETTMSTVYYIISTEGFTVRRGIRKDKNYLLNSEPTDS